MAHPKSPKKRAELRRVLFEQVVQLTDSELSNLIRQIAEKDVLTFSTSSELAGRDCTLSEVSEEK